MRWQIEGADLRSGRDVSVVLEAVDRAEAEAKVGLRGIAWSDIRPLPTPALPPPESLPQMLLPFNASSSV